MMALLNREPLPRIDVAAIRSEHLLSSVIGGAIKLQRAGRELVAPCPFHQDRTPSFTINDDKGFYHCFGCGAHGDVIDWVMHAQGVTFVVAAEILSSGGYVSAPMSHGGRDALPPEPDRSEEAAALWNASAPAAGTVVQAYLRSRAIMFPPPSCLRFAMLRHRGEDRPVMVAAVSSLKGEIMGV
jgi:DNA primase